MVISPVVARRSTVGLLLLVVAVLFTACRDEEVEPQITLSETPVLIGTGSYALITVEYGRLYEASDPTSAIIGHGRRGDVLSVLDTTPNQDWYFLEAANLRGWIERELIRLYPTEQQARNARGARDLR